MFCRYSAHHHNQNSCTRDDDNVSVKLYNSPGPGWLNEECSKCFGAVQRIYQRGPVIRVSFNRPPHM